MAFFISFIVVDVVATVVCVLKGRFFSTFFGVGAIVTASILLGGAVAPSTGGLEDLGRAYGIAFFTLFGLFPLSLIVIIGALRQAKTWSSWATKQAIRQIAKIDKLVAEADEHLDADEQVLNVVEAIWEAAGTRSSTRSLPIYALTFVGAIVINVVVINVFRLIIPPETFTVEAGTPVFAGAGLVTGFLVGFYITRQTGLSARVAVITGVATAAILWLSLALFEGQPILPLFVAPISAVLAAGVIDYSTQRNGVLIAANKRLLFYGKKMTGFDLESIPYETISSIESDKAEEGGGKLKFDLSGSIGLILIQAKNLDEFIATVKSKMGEA